MWGSGTHYSIKWHKNHVKYRGVPNPRYRLSKVETKNTRSLRFGTKCQEDRKSQEHNGKYNNDEGDLGIHVSRHKYTEQNSVRVRSFSKIK